MDFYLKKENGQDKRQAVCEQATNKYVPMGGDDILAKTIRCYRKMKARMEKLAQVLVDEG